MTEPSEDNAPAGEPRERSILATLKERPLGIGLWIGIVFGALNAIMLGIPMLASMAIGGLLGFLVCAFGCPHMRSRMNARRQRKRELLLPESKRVRATSVFSAFD
ncbi:MAG: LapA family protein [Candidatus Poseidoniaceae archaeon]|jgi:hypothetical protein|nr:LapA family protein [Candidatus Poseidoniaceae archaeon]MDP7203294.1 LapA family protein [Candidatus Poseidoniaceae archaeon]